MIRLAALSLALTGCATSWIITQAAGQPYEWDEQVEEVRVPQPGFTEHLNVTFPLVTQYAPPPAATAGQPAAAPKVLPFHLECSSRQHGEDRVYRHGYRYGKRWKTGTAIAVLVEGGLGALGLLTATAEKPFGYVYGTYFALDAAIALPLLFIPKKEVFRTTNEPVDQDLTRVCPEGLAIVVAGQSFPVDAVGQISADAENAIGDWMTSPRGALELAYGGQARELPIGGNELCVWARDHHDARCETVQVNTQVFVTFGVAGGTLTRVSTSSQP
jgi:hypothetical protein